MKYLTLLFAVALFGCKNTGTLELEVLTKEVNALELDMPQYGPDYIKTDELAVDGSRTVLTYKLTNQTDTAYYFNVDGYQKALNSRFREQITINNALLSIYDASGKPVMARAGQPSVNFDPEYLYGECLGYNHAIDIHKKNFIIHPGETLYFEWFIVLPFGSLLEGTNFAVELDESKKYFAQVVMASTSNPKNISRTDLKTIEENGYTVFNGTIKSKNKIPVVFNKEK